MQVKIFLVIFLQFSTICFLKGENFYVSENGTAKGNGSLDNPFDLNTALVSKQKISGGDTIFIREGRYKGLFTCTLTGTKEAPVVITALPGNRVIIDGDVPSTKQNEILKVQGDYLIFKDFEITHSNPDRRSQLKGSNPADIKTTTGLSVFGENNKFINLIIHDLPGNNIGLWKTAVNAEVYGCILYYPGWEGPDRGHGYNIYTQNGSPDFIPVEYSAGIVVRYKDGYYISKRHHGDEIREWKASKRYNKNFKVFYQGNHFVSKVSFPKAGIKPGESPHWVRVESHTIDSHLPTDPRYWEYAGKEDPAGFKYIVNNFIFSSHRIGISSYTKKGTIKNYVFEGNTIFDNGQLSKNGRNWNLLAGGLNPADNIYLNNNTFYHNKNFKNLPVELGYKNENGRAVLTANTFINTGLYLSKWNDVTLTNNTFTGKNLLHLKINDGNVFSSYHLDKNYFFTDNPQSIKLEGVKKGKGDLSILKDAGISTKDYIRKRSEIKDNNIVIIPNKYDKNKIHITIHNFRGDDEVELYLNDYITEGTKYKVLDVQNYFGKPVLVNKFDGKPIVLPMILTEVAKPYGNVSVQPVHTEKDLGTFIVILDK